MKKILKNICFLHTREENSHKHRFFSRAWRKTQKHSLLCVKKGPIPSWWRTVFNILVDLLHYENLYPYWSKALDWEIMTFDAECENMMSGRPNFNQLNRLILEFSLFQIVTICHPWNLYSYYEQILKQEKGRYINKYIYICHLLFVWFILWSTEPGNNTYQPFTFWVILPVDMLLQAAS